MLIVVTLSRVPRLLTLLLSALSGKRGIFTHFPLPGQHLSPLICITMLLIPDYPDLNLLFYEYLKPVNVKFN